MGALGWVIPGPRNDTSVGLRIYEATSLQLQCGQGLFYERASSQDTLTLREHTAHPAESLLVADGCVPRCERNMAVKLRNRMLIQSGNVAIVGNPLSTPTGGKIADNSRTPSPIGDPARGRRKPRFRHRVIIPDRLCFCSLDKTATPMPTISTLLP